MKFRSQRAAAVVAVTLTLATAAGMALSCLPRATAQ